MSGLRFAEAQYDWHNVRLEAQPSLTLSTSCRTERLTRLGRLCNVGQYSRPRANLSSLRGSDINAVPSILV
jgi:hypothetical protein